MTAKELIEKLQGVPAYTPVYVVSEEGDLLDPEFQTIEVGRYASGGLVDLDAIIKVNEKTGEYANYLKAFSNGQRFKAVRL